MIILMLLIQGLIAEQSEEKLVQEIDFEEMEVEGKSIHPEGSFLVERPGIQFQSLLDLKMSVDHQLRKTHMRLAEGGQQQ